MDLTNSCNLRCTMCHHSIPEVAARRRRDLSPSEFRAIADQVFPFAHGVGLSLGSEPLLNSWFNELVRIAREHRVPHLQMITNGLLLEADTADFLVQTGFNAVTVSIDAASKGAYERIRRGASFEKLIANLERLKRFKEERGSRRPQVNFICVLMRSNLEEIPALIPLARTLGVENVHLAHLVPYAQLGTEQESLVHDREGCNRMLQEARRAAGEEGVLLHDPGDFPESSGEEPLPAEGAHLDGAKTSDPRHFQGVPCFEPDDPPCCLFPWCFVGIDHDLNVLPCGWRYNDASPSAPTP